MRFEFEWNSGKAKANVRKHRVSFKEAVTVFYDENAFEFYDPEHSIKEDRFLLLGLSRSARILVISFCHRKNDAVFRIISARKANRSESQNYFKRRGSKKKSGLRR